MTGLDTSVDATTGTAQGVDTVHLWPITLEGAHDGAAALAWTLSGDERRRADSFRSPLDRARFVTTRVVLRQLLGLATGTAPERLTFRYGDAGKPALESAKARSGVAFNVAHAGGRALIAIARGRCVGVDVEALRPVPELAQVATMVCSARERAELDALPPGARCAAFLRAWTRKEAILKALGVGLRWPPERIEVTLTPGCPAAHGAPTRAGDRLWQLSDVPLGGDAVAALAVELRAADEVVAVAMHSSLPTTGERTSWALTTRRCGGLHRAERSATIRPLERHRRDPGEGTRACNETERAWCVAGRMGSSVRWPAIGCVLHVHRRRIGTIGPTRFS